MGVVIILTTIGTSSIFRRTQQTQCNLDFIRLMPHRDSHVSHEFVLLFTMLSITKKSSPRTVNFPALASPLIVRIQRELGNVSVCRQRVYNVLGEITGEGGIRTRGTETAHWFSKPAPSATRTPLPNAYRSAESTRSCRIGYAFGSPSPLGRLIIIY